jgi:hypothetical protein
MKVIFPANYPALLGTDMVGNTKLIGRPGLLGSIPTGAVCDGPEVTRRYEFTAR